MGNRLAVNVDWYTRVGDDAAYLQATLSDGAGDAIDLTGLTVTLLAYGPGADVSEVCTVLTPASGVVTVQPTFTEAGIYYARFKVLYGNGSILTCPTNDDVVIEVRGPE